MKILIPSRRRRSASLWPLRPNTLQLLVRNSVLELMRLPSVANLAQAEDHDRHDPGRRSFREAIEFSRATKRVGAHRVPAFHEVLARGRSRTWICTE